MEAPRQVEMILKHGNVSSTYKFALLKRIIDYVIIHPTEEISSYFELFTYFHGKTVLFI